MIYLFLRRFLRSGFGRRGTVFALPFFGAPRAQRTRLRVGDALDRTLGPAVEWLTELFNKIGSAIHQTQRLDNL